MRGRLRSILTLVWDKVRCCQPIIVHSLPIDDISNLCNGMNGWHIVSYADDILLISSSVSHSELLLHACERELEWIDMAINF